MKKTLFILLSLLVVALFVGCTPKVESSADNGDDFVNGGNEANGGQNQEPYTGDSTWADGLEAAIDPRPKEYGPDGEELPHGDLSAEWRLKYNFEFYGLSYSLFESVGEEKIDEWIAQFEPSKGGTRNSSEAHILNAIKELGLSKEEFIKANNPPIYSLREIDALYSGDEKLINNYFVNASALLFNDEIYTPSWLALHSASDYEKAGLTVDLLEDYLAGMEPIQLAVEYLAIKSTLVKAGKLSDKAPSEPEYYAPYKLKFYGIDDFIYKLVDEAKLDKWREQFMLESVGRDRRDASEANIFNLVKELAIPREAFEKANNAIYTKQEVDAIYSGSLKQVNLIFASKYALVDPANGNIYTLRWLSSEPISRFTELNLSKEMLRNYLKNITDPALSENYQAIIEKINSME